jgi:hypothetical protein
MTREDGGHDDHAGQAGPEGLTRWGDQDTPVEYDVPWILVGDGEAAALMLAYGQAVVVVRDLRAALAAVGLGPRDYPQLCAGVDAAGQPKVILGAVSMRAAHRLAELLHGMPNPPSPGQSQAA